MLYKSGALINISAHVKEHASRKLWYDDTDDYNGMMA